MIVALADYYLPGYKGGGPITTLAGMVARLGDEFPFCVVTRDRDLGDAAPYPGEAREARVDGAQVHYLAPGELTPAGLRRRLRPLGPGVLYLNSFFSPRFSLLPLALHAAGALPGLRRVLLAPRGEFSPGALALKPIRKRACIAAARATGLHRRVLWQASGAEEAEHIRALFPRAEVCIAPDLAPPAERAAPARDKRPGELRVVFLSRISPKKNLLGAIELLAGAGVDAELDIYGPPEDPAYWGRCQQALAALPPRVRATVHGAIVPERVPEVLGSAHLLLLPTLGENYGHVVLEALRAGCLPLISDQTPWKGLAARRAGWEVPLGDPAGFHAALRQAAAMDQAEWELWSAAAARLGTMAATDPVAEEQNRRLLRTALGRGTVAGTTSAR